MGRKRHAVGEAGEEGTTYEGAGHPLLTALFEGDVDGARRVLEAGDCDIEVVDQLGWRPLHRATFAGLDSIVATLLERRANVSVADTDGLQPLHIAAAGGHVECCKLLLAARADPTAPEQYSGMSAQMYSLVQDGELGAMMKEVLGDPDLLAWAANGDPLAMARHVASVESPEERKALELLWAAELGAEVAVPAAADSCGGDGEDALSRQGPSSGRTKDTPHVAAVASSETACGAGASSSGPDDAQTSGDGATTAALLAARHAEANPA